MTFQAPTPTIAPFIPENAPFNEEQRAWLNGFFAGFLAPQPGDAQPISGDAAGMAEEDDGAPWHDPAMPMDERMKLADGKPIQRRLMAAMAQQDCGQCGYDCHNYSKAIADGAESEAQSLRAGRQGDRAQGEGAVRRDRRRASGRRRLAQGRGEAGGCGGERGSPCRAIRVRRRSTSCSRDGAG